ncbi:MAG: hypothetical protein A3C63_02955 [Candidatus Zambryskibacteria bacterium RIFCSPHIGHO2_02_FULL_39_82]|nr:MAG: hypothetical protein A3C63_02955 [Candidatus Zambryskibacteria bacterium RIFCSPHIGHO2_02_FULL_39_82]OHB12672.1 MAG: hypothetical protein A2Y49_03400 [Candidatus Zambryskibacteria bacterium RIFCSPLOWO2_12_39_8]
MKKFNLLVVGLWFFVFATSLFSTFPGSNQYTSWTERFHLDTILTVNQGFFRYTPFELRGTDAEQLALVDSEMTQMFLRQSFVTLAFILLALNI